jgi:hypothetical protein
MMGGEHRFTDDVSAAIDLGYILASGYLGTTSDGKRDQSVSGFTVRPSIKYFINEKKTFYLQPQFFYKQVTHHRLDWLAKEVVNGVAAYEQLQEFRYRRRSYGMNFMAGTMVPISRNKKTFLDFYFGLGFRKKTATVLGEKNSSFNSRTLMGNTSTADHGTFPSMPAGIRLMFVIN